MYRVYFYCDKHGQRPIADYIAKLALKGDKDSRIKTEQNSRLYQGAQLIWNASWRTLYEAS